MRRWGVILLGALLPPLSAAAPLERAITVAAVAPAPHAAESAPAHLRPPPGDQEGQIRQGEGLVRAGRYPEALLLLRPLAEETDASWQTLFWAGTAALGTGNLVLAENWLNRALAKESGNATLWLQRALVEEERGEAVAALHFLNTARKLAPDHIQVILNYAYVMDALDRREEAVAQYSRFLLLTADHPGYTALRLKIVQRIGRLSEGAIPGEGTQRPHRSSLDQVTTAPLSADPG